MSELILQQSIIALLEALPMEDVHKVFDTMVQEIGEGDQEYKGYMYRQFNEAVSKYLVSNP